MTEQPLLGSWIRRFVLEYLPQDRNLAANTRRSYRDMFCLLIPFAADRLKRAVDSIEVRELSADVVKDFLIYLRDIRKCCMQTCNQRLAAIHAFAYFVGTRSPEHLEWCQQIRGIPFKRAPKSLINYLEKDEMDALLATPDRDKSQGFRDYALLLFLYNSGARASEAAELRISSLEYTPGKWDDGVVKIFGKGGKTRRCPLWRSTIQVLHELISNRELSEYVFLNRNRRPITRMGIYEVVTRNARRAAITTLSFATKRVGPHTIRHTAATHLLRAGVDINTIRDWLGHVELVTTNIYAQIDLEMKANALAKCEIKDNGNEKRKRWRDQLTLMEFLRNL